MLIVFCNSLFYYSYFNFSLLKAKLAAELTLAKTSLQAGSDVIKVPICELQKDELDEVWYNGNLYDVVERDRINDTVYVFLLRDEQEQNVLADNYRYFQGSGGVLSVGRHEVTSTKITLSIIDTEHISKYQLTLLKPERFIKPLPASIESPLSATCAETPSPPPRLA